MFIVPKILYIKSSCVDIIGNYHQIEGKEGTNNAAYTKGETDGQIRRRLKRVALAVSEALKAIFFPCSFLLFVTFQIMLGRLCLTRSRDFVICLYTCIRRHLKETVLWGTITWSKMGKQTFKLKGILYLNFFFVILYSGLCMLITCLIYPVGWNSTAVKAVCGPEADRYKIGNCNVNWAYWIAIICMADAFVLSYLSLMFIEREIGTPNVTSRRQESNGTNPEDGIRSGRAAEGYHNNDTTSL